MKRGKCGKTGRKKRRKKLKVRSGEREVGLFQVEGS